MRTHPDVRRRVRASSFTTTFLVATALVAACAAPAPRSAPVQPTPTAGVASRSPVQTLTSTALPPTIAPGSTPSATMPSALLFPAGTPSMSAIPTASAAPRAATGPTSAEPAAYAGARFPPGYTGYHTYTQMVADIAAVARAHPDLVDLFSIGRSYQGANIWAARVSEDVAIDHGRPEALFDGLHHGLEHMSLEMTLAILHWLADGYGRDPDVTTLLQTRAVDIVFAVNPDGASYDIRGGSFHEWRKNRQPGPGGVLGTDLNRNYPYHWGCCGLVSADPSSPYFRGTAPLSAPESRALADFVRSRVIGGRQRITVAVSFHASGRLVMWPYGWTTTAVPRGMTADDHAVFVKVGRTMASLDGYRPIQASGLYVDSGTSRDWEYGAEHIFAFTIELGSGTYQTSGAIAPETARNRSAVLYLIGMADCPYRAIGKQATYCQGG